MDSRFRKELTTVPAVRVKVSKQGLTTTIKWRGDAPGSDHSPVGRGGSRSLRQLGDPRLSGPLPTDPFLIPGTRRDFGGGSLADMTSPGLASFKELLIATRRREQEIKADIRKAKWQLRLAWAGATLGWISLVSVAAKPIRNRAIRGLALRRSELAMLSDNLATTRISVNFDMDSEIAEPHRRMQANFDRMAGIEPCMERRNGAAYRPRKGKELGGHHSFARTGVFAESGGILGRNSRPASCIASPQR